MIGFLWRSWPRLSITAHGTRDQCQSTMDMDHLYGRQTLQPYRNFTKGIWKGILNGNLMDVLDENLNGNLREIGMENVLEI